MEVSLTSVQQIRPFPGATHELKPFKLSMLDQLIPSITSPLIFFYPYSKPNTSNSDHNHMMKLVSSNLKSSLSKTLNSFYPLSGRLINDTFIHDFHQGVPFAEARIPGQRLADFLQPPNLELLNYLLPLEPGCLLPSNGPQLSVQLNTFDCGGIALGLSLHHRLFDGATTSLFLKTWPGFTNPTHNKRAVPDPDLVSASSVFPPFESMPVQKMPPLSMLMKQGSSKPRRFVFDNDAVSRLRSMARSDGVENPSRTEALFAFMWRSVMKAAVASADADTQSPKPLRFRQSVDMRSRMGQRLSKRSIGNLVASAVVSWEEDSCSMKEIVARLRAGVQRIDENYLNSLSSSGGNGDLDMTTLAGSSWAGFGYNKFDFGLGDPIWTGMYGHGRGGEHGFAPNFSAIGLKEVGGGQSLSNGIEAWTTLDEGVMAALQRDPEFLKFASLNPAILFN